MKTLVIVALFAALPLHTTLAVAGDSAPSTQAVAGQKLDSGLGELPHYRLWADKSGKNVVGTSVVADPNGRSAANGQRVAPASSPKLQSTDVAALK